MRSPNTEINILIHVRAKLPGFNSKYAFATAVGKTWVGLFREHEIPFDRRQHTLLTKKRCGNETLNVTEPVDVFFKSFRSQTQRQYTAYIVRKDPSRSNSSDGQSCTVLGNGHSPLTTDHNLNPNEARISRGTRNVPELILSDQTTRPVPAVASTSRGIVRPLQAISEETSDGNIVHPDQQNVQGVIRKYLTTRISNEDMLRIRDELQSLLHTKQYERLQRLVPFTSGVLRSAFLDSV